MPDGHLLEFDRRTGTPVRYTGGRILKEEPPALANAAGISLVSEDGVTIDCGVKIGESPITEPGRHCTVLSKGKSCSKVSVADLVSSSDREVIKESDAELAEIFASRCPGMDFSILQPSSLALRNRALQGMAWEDSPKPQPSSNVTPEVRGDSAPPKAPIPLESISSPEEPTSTAGAHGAE